MLLGGETYRDRLMTPEGAMEVAQYEYNLITHEIKPLNMELMDDDDEDGMEGFDGVATPFKT
eukprot:15345014-Ditylum_brightwellii.AAC.1